MTYNYLFKYIQVGDSGVGKSCILFHFIDNVNVNEPTGPTIGVQFQSKTIPLEEKIFKLQLWDLSGNEGSLAYINSYFRGAIGALLFYDVTNKYSFLHLKKWVRQLRNYANEYMQILLVGNKTDIKRKRVISRERALKFAAENGAEFVEVTKQDHQSIYEAYLKLTRRVYDSIKSKAIPVDGNNLGIKVTTDTPPPPPGKPKKNC